MNKRADTFCKLLELAVIVMMCVYIFTDSKWLLCFAGGMGIASMIMELALNPIEDDEEDDEYE